MKKLITITIIVVGAVLLSGQMIGKKEANFTVYIRAYDTNIPEATIEGVTIKNVRQFNVINEPSDLIVKKGTKVNVTIVNESPITENLSIEGYPEVNWTLKTKEKKQFSFIANKAGSYTIWCNLHPKNVHLPGTLLVYE